MMRFPITIELRPSRRWDGVLIAVHLLAALALWAPPWPLPAKAGALLLVVFSAAWARRGRGLAVDGLRLLAGGQLEARPAGRADFEKAVVLPRATVYPWLTVFALRFAEPPGNRPRYVVLLPDCLAAEDFRRLRVWLRWRADFSAADEAA